MKWRPDKVIERVARALCQRAAAQIRGGAAHVPNEGSSGPVGGSLAQQVAARSFVLLRPWGAVLPWSRLGQKFLWFVEGTSRQRPRPVDTIPDKADLTRQLQADAERHWQKRASA